MRSLADTVASLTVKLRTTRVLVSAFATKSSGSLNAKTAALFAAASNDKGNPDSCSHR